MPADPESAWLQAFDQLESILQLLDDSGAPDDVRAYLDLALCRLSSAVHGEVDQPGELKPLPASR